MLRAFNAALTEAPPDDMLFVAHGAVASLLEIALAGARIDRRHDQPAGGGNVWEASRTTRAILSHWRPIESFAAG